MVANPLRNIREEVGILQDEMCREMGITQQGVSYLENKPTATEQQVRTWYIYCEKILEERHIRLKQFWDDYNENVRNLKNYQQGVR